MAPGSSDDSDEIELYEEADDSERTSQVSMSSWSSG
jgi:hypothetical protein